MSGALTAVVIAGCLTLAWYASDGTRSLLLPAAAPRAGEGRAAGHAGPSRSPASASAPAASRSASSRAPTVTGTARRPRKEAPVRPPDRVEIPALGISAKVISVGLGRDGSVSVPTPSLVGWYRKGPSPGERGPAVLVGHIDSRTGPAVFYRLPSAHVGDVVAVRHTDRSVTRFTVSDVTEVHKSRFPTAQVFAPTDAATLRLITCTGTFDPASRQYQDSLIVWAKLVT